MTGGDGGKGAFGRSPDCVGALTMKEDARRYLPGESTPGAFSALSYIIQHTPFTSAMDRRTISTKQWKKTRRTAQYGSLEMQLEGIYRQCFWASVGLSRYSRLSHRSSMIYDL